VPNARLIDKLFERFGRHLEAAGYIARGGQIIDATIVPVPKQRNTKEENEAIKAGKTPEGWEQQPTKNAQKDKDERWTQEERRELLRLQEQSRSRKSAQDDRWSFCLTAGTLWPNQERSCRDELAGTTSSGWQLRPLECAHGWSLCGIVQKDRAIAGQGSKGPRSGAHRGTGSAKPLITEKWVLFEVPCSLTRVSCAPYTKFMDTRSPQDVDPPHLLADREEPTRRRLVANR
jgi:hypothetical protein